MNEELENYELFVNIERTPEGKYNWGIGQELVLDFSSGEFEFLAGGQEDSLEEAAARVSEEIKALF